MGDTGLKLYVNAITAVDRNVIFKTVDQRIEFTCTTGFCTNSTTAYLSSEDCDLAESNGGKSENVPTNTGAVNFTAVNGGDDTKFFATFNASALAAGVYYKLCSDLDGSGALFFGDTGYDMYISPIRSISMEGAIEKNVGTYAPNILTVTCWPDANCDANTRVHIDTACDKDITNG
ncbi:unnamed protein product, partial [Amoebophrya sp. A25]|eukprot:GSA25T00024939001.1